MRVCNIACDDWANFAYDNTQALLSVGVDAVCLKRNTHIRNYPNQGMVAGIAEMKREIQKADYVQLFFSHWRLYKELKPEINDKKLIVWNAGTNYRIDPDLHNRIFNPYVHKTVSALGELCNRGAKNEVYMVGAIDTERIIGNKPIFNNYIIGHYPHNTEVKGTEKINEIIGKLKKNFVYLTSNTQVDYSEQLKRMDECDIYIELFAPTNNGKKYGSFGITALEAASMGKIVITQNLSSDIYFENYGECELLLALDEEDMLFKLRILLEMNPIQLKRIQDKTREWVVKNHSYKATGQRMLEKVLC